MVEQFGLPSARGATVQVVQVRKGREKSRGQGLLLDLGNDGTVVLTCHHVIAPVAPGELFVRVPQDDGQLGSRIRTTYDADRSRPEIDAVVLRVDQGLAPGRNNPLLHALSLDTYNSRLKATCLTHLQPDNFDLRVGPSTHLNLSAQVPGAWPNPPAEYRLRAFRAIDPSDTKPGISGGVVVCEDGVLGLVHFARAESAARQREAYIVPITAWGRDWPALTALVEPLIDRQLRFSANIQPARDLIVGADIMVEEYRPDIYLEREADQKALAAFRASGNVVVVGRPLSGKTRLVLQLVRQSPDTLVVIPRTDRPPQTFENAGLSGKSLLLLFDDVHRVAETIRPLEWQERMREASGQPCKAIFTSRDGSDWKRVTKSQGRLIEVIGDAGIVATSYIGDRGQDMSRAQGEQLATAFGMSRDEFTRRFDGTPGSLSLDIREMRGRYARLRDLYIGEVAASRLLDAAKLLFQAYQPRFTRSLLKAVSDTILGDSVVSAEVWGTIERRTSEEGFGRFDTTGDFQSYRPYLERAVEYTATVNELKKLLLLLQSIQDRIGCYLLGISLMSKARSLAEEALKAALPDVAEANNALGVLLAQQPGREQEAEKFFLAGVAEGIELAYVNYAHLLARLDGRAHEAEVWLREAIGRGVTQAYESLGNHLRTLPGREKETEDAYRQGSQAGDAHSTYNLGTYLMLQPGREEEAEQILRRAIQEERPEAYRNLGILLRNLGRVHEALKAYRHAIKNGDTGAYNHVAELLFENGFRKTAVRTLQAAIELGDSLAHANLGVYLVKQGRLRAGIGKFRDGIRAGDAVGYKHVAVLLAERGLGSAAEDFFRRAVEEDVASARSGLAALLQSQPDRQEEAEQILRDGAAAGDAKASLNLGVLLGARFFQQQADGKQADWSLASDAARAYRRALASGTTAALLPLGVMLAQTPGSEVEGCALVRHAIALKIPKADEMYSILDREGGCHRIADFSRSEHFGTSGGGMRTFTWQKPHLQGLGPRIKVVLWVHPDKEAELKATEQPLPDFIRGDALIDTGTSHSIIRTDLAETLGLTRIGDASVKGAGSGNIVSSEYTLSIVILDPDEGMVNGVPLQLSAITSDLEGQNLSCVIGRDALSLAEFRYDPLHGKFSLTFDLPEHNPA
jgi:tetratricopeptide (TPR) repeat protein